MIVAQEKFTAKEEKLLCNAKSKYERKTFGKWFICQVLKRTERKQKRKVVAKCEQCSKFYLMDIENVTRKHSFQCFDCSKFIHKMSYTATYRTWISMKSRCLNSKKDNYARYGGVGIGVCDRWRNSFECFLQDMGERPHNQTIDRIDPSGDYTKENCRWATIELQNENKKNRVSATHNGETKLLTEWCRILNLSHATLLGRLRRGQAIAQEGV